MIIDWDRLCQVSLKSVIFCANKRIKKISFYIKHKPLPWTLKNSGICASKTGQNKGPGRIEELIFIPFHRAEICKMLPVFEDEPILLAQQALLSNHRGSSI